MKLKNDKDSALLIVALASVAITAFAVHLSRGWGDIVDENLHPFLAGSFALIAINHMLVVFFPNYFKAEMAEELSYESEEDVDFVVFCLFLALTFGFSFIGFVVSHTFGNIMLGLPAFASTWFWLLNGMVEKKES